jgi:hypothetical protein
LVMRSFGDSARTAVQTTTNAAVAKNAEMEGRLMAPETVRAKRAAGRSKVA